MTLVSSITFQYVLKALEHNTKIPSGEMLAHVGLKAEQLAKNVHGIDSRRLSAIFRYCMEKTDNPYLSLDIGRSIPYQSLGILGYLLMNTKTLREMIEKFSVYQKLISEHLKFYFSDDGKFCKFAIYIDGNKKIPVPSYHAEVHMSGILSILTGVLGRHIFPAQTHFTGEKPSDCTKHRELFGDNISFGKEENALFFKKDELDIPVNNANQSMLDYFETQAANLLQEQENSSWFGRVEKEILKNIGDGGTSIELISSCLNVSVRTLQNYLKAEGKTFMQALTDVRRRLAGHYILNTKLDDASISALLGYSEVSAFYRAYKKWNKSTPKYLRKK